MNRERIIKYNRGRRRTRKCPVPGYRCKRRTRCNKTEGRCSISSKPTRRFTRRCYNGSQRQKRGDGCDETGLPKYPRCKNGTRRHKRTHECDRKVGDLLEEKNRERILARGQHVARRDKSANANVKKQTRNFTFANDAAVLNKYRERRGDNILPRESDENLAADNDENLAADNEENLAADNDENLAADNNEDNLANNYDMGEFGDYHEDGNGNEEENLPPILEEVDENGNGNAVVEAKGENSRRQARPKIKRKFHNTRGSSLRTRSETDKSRRSGK